MSEKYDLTPLMEDTLRIAAFGIRKYSDGYRSIDNQEKVDGRVLNALHHRGLVWWQSAGGHPQRIVIYTTPEGDNLYERLRDAGRWD